MSVWRSIITVYWSRFCVPWSFQKRTKYNFIDEKRENKMSCVFGYHDMKF